MVGFEPTYQNANWHLCATMLRYIPLELDCHILAKKSTLFAKSSELEIARKTSFCVGWFFLITLLNVMIANRAFSEKIGVAMARYCVVFIMHLVSLRRRTGPLRIMGIEFSYPVRHIFAAMDAHIAASRKEESSDRCMSDGICETFRITRSGSKWKAGFQPACGLCVSQISSRMQCVNIFISRQVWC